MSESPRPRPNTLEAVANEPLHLSTDSVEVRFGSGAAERGAAEVYLRLLPSPSIEFRVTFTGEFQSLGALFGPNAHGPATITFLERQAAASVHISQTRIGDGPHLVATLVGEEVTTGTAVELHRVDFRVLNFPDFLTPLDVPGDAHRRLIQSVELAAEGWRVTLDAAPGITEVVNTLRATGGYGLTHIGHLVRADGVTFGGVEARDVLSSLHYFLAFASGRWAPPLLPVGYDTTGALSWEEWRVPTSSRWSGRDTWFDRHTGNQLIEVYPGFWRLWNSTVWRLPLRKVIHWFVSSNMGHGGVEGALVLSFTALELLAWVTLVDDRSRLSRRQFKRLSAADVLRTLIGELEIPAGVPSEVAALAALASGPGDPWDGPEALAKVRNGIVHPEARDRASTASVRARVDAWSLSQWYLELALLRLCDHHGTYGSRLARARWVGQVTRVPWSAQGGG
jgi:hypothetical protein